MRSGTTPSSTAVCTVTLQIKQEIERNWFSNDIYAQQKLDNSTYRNIYADFLLRKTVFNNSLGIPGPPVQQTPFNLSQL